MTIEACAAKVAAGDPNRFAAVMATAAGLRARLWPLYAANLEIARAPWASSEPMIAEMRLQWWVDAFDALATSGRAPAHELGAAFAGLRPAAAILGQIAEARRRDCWREDFGTVEELWAYLGATSGGLFEAAGIMLDTPAPALRAYGQAAGMAGWYLAAPEIAQRGVAPFPEAADLAGLAEEARRRLAAARHALPPAARTAALAGWDADAVLRRASRAPGKVMTGDLRGSEFSRRFSLLQAAFRA